MSSTQITRDQLESAISRFERANEFEYNKAYLLYLENEADFKVYWSTIRSKLTFGLSKIKTKEKAFSEAKEEYGKWATLEAPDFEYFKTWSDSKSRRLRRFLGPKSILSGNHAITISDQDAFILDWIK